MERSVIERWSQTPQLLVSRPPEEASRLSFIISRVGVICSRPINKQQQAVRLEVEADVLELELLSSILHICSGVCLAVLWIQNFWANKESIRFSFCRFYTKSGTLRWTRSLQIITMHQVFTIKMGGLCLNINTYWKPNEGRSLGSLSHQHSKLIHIYI